MNKFGVTFTGNNDRRKFNTVKNMWTIIQDQKGRASRVQLVSMREHKDRVSFGLKYVSDGGKKSGMVRISENKPFGIDVMTTSASIGMLLEIGD